MVIAKAIWPHTMYILLDTLTCLLSCLCLLWSRFSPEVLGLCASTALVWMVIEVLAMLLSLYLLTVHSDLSTFDLIAYSGYKYVG